MTSKTIGIVGGGQLCLMMGEAIKTRDLPYRLIAVDPSPQCPALPVIDKHIPGDFKDEEKIKQLATQSDIVGFEIELANSGVLADLSAQGKPIHPSPQTLSLIQDKLVQADFLHNHNLPVPGFKQVDTRQDMEAAIAAYGLPLMLKARTDSYDGRGNYVLRKQADMGDALRYFNGRPLMAQQYIPFDTEISVIAARATDDRVSTFPVGENIHGKDYNILQTTIVPARVKDSIIQKAGNIAEAAMKALQGAGVFGIEMLVAGDEVLINEIAPRVHNSGHYSIEGCQTSQFEQHLRAIAGQALGGTSLVADAAVMHNINGPESLKGAYRIMYEGQAISGTTPVGNGAVIHNYGKDITKPYRKMGHVTVVAQQDESQEALIRRAEEIRKQITIEEAHTS